MKKIFIIYFYVIFLLFSLISPFVFITSNLDNFNKINSNFLYLENLKSNDIFKDLSYKETNKYDFQSTLMLRQDYFMQGLDPSNYAFSFGFQYFSPLTSVSADKNDSNYWFNVVSVKNIDFNLSLYNKDEISSLKIINDNSGFNFNLNFRYGDINYKFLAKNIKILKYFFIPYFSNQSYRHFDLDFLMFNFNYKSLINLQILNELNVDFFINNIKQEEININDFYKMFDNFFSQTLMSIFDITNIGTKIVYYSNNGFTNFTFFVKNGFLLYPKSMLFNLRDVSSEKANPYVIMYNAYKINSTSDYYSFYSNWEYKTDILPLNNNFSKSIKMLDMDDTSKYKGFNVFTFYSGALDIKQNQFSIFGFNFSIYNSDAWNDEINAGDIWKLPYSSCAWFNVFCHIKNGFILAFNTLPGIKEVGKYANALVNTMQNVNLLWDNISNFFAFDIAFKLLLGAIITLAMFNGILRFL